MTDSLEESWRDIDGLDASATEKHHGFQLEHGCAVLFDLFHTCSSVKGRLRDYYRYGRVRSCLPYWNDFFLCMRLKMETDETRAQAKWQSQRDCSARERFNMSHSGGDSPTIGVIWERADPRK